MKSRVIRPPRRLQSCPDCGGKIAIERGRYDAAWRCRDRYCGTRGVLFADGHLAVTERYAVMHRPFGFKRSVAP